jgi:hypothetical protein
MLFIVRGKNQNSDRTLRVHAHSAEEAEKIGWKRGLFVTEVTPVENSNDVGALEKLADLAWKLWRHTPANAFKAFGRTVSSAQSVTLMALGLATWVVDLHALNFI